MSIRQSSRLCIFVLLWLVITADPSWAVLAQDVQLVHVAGVGSTSDSFTGPNVGASATVVVFTVMCSITNSTTAPANMSVTWDSGGTNQAATQFGSTITSNTGASEATGFIFFVLAPTAGAKTVALSWTNAHTCYTNVVSYTGGDTSTPLGGFSSNTGTSITSLVVTQSPSAPSGDLILSAGVHSSGTATTTSSDNNSGSELYNSSAGCCSSAGRTSGSGGTAFTYTFSVSVENAVALSVDVKAPSSGGGGAAQPANTIRLQSGRAPIPGEPVMELRPR